jgi:tetratricopeptide (TPR) repeat protein
MITSKQKFYTYKEQLKFILNKEDLEELESDKTNLIDLGFESIELSEYQRAYDIFMINIKTCGHSAEALNGLAISLLELGNIQAAQKVLKETSRMFPNDAITLANVAGIYWECNKHDKALFYYAKSLKLNRSIIDTHFNIINLYYERGELFMAYTSCLKMLSIFPNNKQAIELSKEILLDLGVSMY